MIETLILFLALALFLMIMLSPLEALSWWAGWFSPDGTEDHTSESLRLLVEASPNDPPDGIQQYAIYMTGVGGFSREAFLPEERHFMDSLAAALPDVRLVDNVYPYSVLDRGLTEGRIFSRFWRFAASRKAHRSIVGFTINIRNMMQVLVAADSRYGPIYGWGLANILIRALAQHDYPFGTGMPVTLIGYSGGGEMAAQSVLLLRHVLQAPIRVISLGGFISNEPNVADVEHLYHIYGTKDRVQRLGLLLFPGRWPFAPWSTWNRARATGKITIMPIGPFKHNGPGGYLDQAAHLPDGRSHLDVTITTIVRLLHENPHVTPAPTEAETSPNGS